MLVRHRPGETVALVSGPANPGIRHGAEKYGKFAYSTRYAFSIEDDLRNPGRAVLDSSPGLIDEDGTSRVRSEAESSLIGDGFLFSRWKPWPDVTIGSWLFWSGLWHVRCHHIQKGRRLSTVEGGFAIPVLLDQPIIVREVPLGVAVVGGGEFSGIRDLSSVARSARAHRCPPNTNLMAPRTMVPQLFSQVEVGGRWLMGGILAGGETTPLGLAWADPPQPPDPEALSNALRRMSPVAVADRRRSA